MPTGVPIYVKVDPNTGEVTNEFEGHIKADGIELPAAVDMSNPQDDSYIEWVRESDGAEIAFIVGASEPFAGNVYRSGLQATADGPRSAIEHFQVGGNVQVEVVANLQRKNLLLATGESNFLTIPSARKSSAGRVTVQFPAGANFSNIINVNHGIPAPLNAVAAPLDFTGRFIGGTCYVGAGAHDVQAWTPTPFAAATNVTMAWLAWGN